MASVIVSIITPVYNLRALLPATLRSVLSQTYADWEHILVDDCSTDDSWEVLQKLAASDARIKTLRMHRNVGAAEARNAAIKLAAGRYIAFLDGDDIWEREKLAKQLAFMQENKAEFTYTNYVEVDESGSKLVGVVESPGRLQLKELIKSNQICCSTVIYDTNTVGKVYMPVIRRRQDWGLWIELVRRGLEPLNVGDYLLQYRVREHSMSSNKLIALWYVWRFYGEVLQLTVFKRIWRTLVYMILSIKKYQRKRAAVNSRERTPI